MHVSIDSPADLSLIYISKRILSIRILFIIKP